MLKNIFPLKDPFWFLKQYPNINAPVWLVYPTGIHKEFDQIQENKYTYKHNGHMVW